ncbi:MAG: ATP-binding protein [bacterium]
MNLIQANFKSLHAAVVLLELSDGREAALDRREIEAPAILNADSDADVQAYFKCDPSILVLCSEPEVSDRPLKAERRPLLRHSHLKGFLTYRLGQTKKLVVRDATSNVYAFGDLSEGVGGRCRKRAVRGLVQERGLLPMKQLDEKRPVTLEMVRRISVDDDDFWRENYPEYELCAADTVLGCISGFEYRGVGDDTVIVDLDPVAYLNRLAENLEDVFEHLGFDGGAALPAALEAASPSSVLTDADMIPLANQGAILIVDDDREGTLLPAKDFLANNGYEVVPAASASEAKGLVNKMLESPGFQTITSAFVDIHLTQDIQRSDHAGIAFAHWLQDRIPNCGIILMSAEGEQSVDGAKQRACGELQVVGYEAKPFKHGRFRSLIRAAALPERLRAADLFVVAPDRTAKTTENLNRLQAQTAQSASDILEELRRRLGADSVYLFRLHRITRVADAESCVGRQFPRFGHFKRGLRYSPVRDVCECREEWCHTNVPMFREGKHRKLLSLCDPAHKYQTCIATPVEQPPGSDYLYSLFAFFYPSTEHGTAPLAAPQLMPGCDNATSPRTREELALAAMREIAHRISRELIINWHIKMRAKEDPVFMAGMLAVSLGHELFHCLQGAEWECAALAPHIKPNITTSREDVVLMDRLKKRTDRAIDIVIGLARQANTDAERESEFDVRDAILSAALSAKMASSGVTVRYFSEPSVLLSGQRGKIERIVHNLVLNAVQQTARSMRRGGLVYVKHYIRDVGRNRQLVVRVFDNGPGIHGYMTKRIFEPGETSRPDGTGMGLTICAQEIDRIGHGSVHVAESILWAGTCFEVAFPSNLLVRKKN